MVPVLSVADLNRYVRGLLERDENLQLVWVRGEMSNFKAHSSGHLYFSLKAEGAAVRAVMFRSRASRMAFRPEDGQEVLVSGRVSLYERDGSYQLYVDAMEPAGVGLMFLQLEELRRRLEAEGLFDQARKRPLPLLPRKIGVATSLEGAAVRDIISVARRRFPGVALVLAPVLVQGALAPPSVVQAVEELCRMARVDVIIVGRGGGAKEDLSPFNDERVVRAVATCPVPVVTAVGHESDVTLVDFAADERAPTPSAAAELVVPRRADLDFRLSSLRQRSESAVAASLQRRRETVDRLFGSAPLRRPEGLVAQRVEYVAQLEKALAAALRHSLLTADRQVARLMGQLDGLSPLGALRRGYALLTREGQPVTSVRGLKAGMAIAARLRDGSLVAEVKNVERTDDL